MRRTWDKDERQTGIGTPNNDAGWGEKQILSHGKFNLIKMPDSTPRSQVLGIKDMDADNINPSTMQMMCTMYVHTRMPAVYMYIQYVRVSKHAYIISSVNI